MVGGCRDGKDGQWPTESAKAACQLAFDHYSAELARRLWAICGDHAGDAMQDAFVKYVTELQRGAKILDPRSWLFRVAMNRALEIRRTTESHRAALIALGKELYAEGESPIIILEHDEAQQKVRDAIKQLPVQLRDMIHLRFFCEEVHSYDEIAEALGLTKHAVNHGLRRALEKLRVALVDIFGEIEAAI